MITKLYSYITNCNAFMFSYVAHIQIICESFKFFTRRTCKNFTVKFLNIRTTEKNCCNPHKSRTKWLFHIVMRPKDAQGIANSVDPDQTARGAV